MFLFLFSCISWYYLYIFDRVHVRRLIWPLSFINIIVPREILYITPVLLRVICLLERPFLSHFFLIYWSIAYSIIMLYLSLSIMPWILYIGHSPLYEKKRQTIIEGSAPFSVITVYWGILAQFWEIEYIAGNILNWKLKLYLHPIMKNFAILTLTLLFFVVVSEQFNDFSANVSSLYFFRPHICSLFHFFRQLVTTSVEHQLFFLYPGMFSLNFSNFLFFFSFIKFIGVWLETDGWIIFCHNLLWLFF